MASSGRNTIIVPPPSPVALLGRDDILAMFDAALDPARGDGETILLEGPPGIGKTALVDWARRFATDRGFTTLAATGVATESRFPYAGLHQMLLPLKDAVASLPDPQREALQGSFRMTATPPTDFYSVALASLTLLTERAEHAPLLIVLDDAHWMDRPTRDVLNFVARRLSNDRIVMIWTRRDTFRGELVDAAVNRVELEPLNDESSRHLLGPHTELLGPTGIKTVLSQAQGNPLALIELPSTAAERTFVYDHDPILLSERLENAFAAQLSDLPAPTRDLLLIIALNDSDSFHESLAAATTLHGESVSARAAEPAITNRIIILDGNRVIFRHPLIRSAVVRGDTLQHQRAAQAALADTLAAIPDREIWHRALSISGADEAVAAALEQAATQSQVYQDVGVAAAGFELAAQLTADPTHRAMRLLRAATCFFQAGHLDLALRLTRDAEGVATDDLQRAHIGWLREFLPGGSLESGRGVGQAMRIVHDMYTGGDRDGALRTLATVAVMVWTISPDPASRTQVLRAADRMNEPFDEPHMLYIRAFAQPHDYAARIIETIAARDPSQVGAEEVQLLAYALSAIGEFELQPLYMVPALDMLSRQGNLVERGQNLIAYAWNQIYRGDFIGARDSIDECIQLCDDTGQITARETSRLVAGVIAAARGDHDAVVDNLERAALVGVASQSISNRDMVQLVKGMDAVASGSHRDAITELLPLIDPQSPIHHPIWSLFGFIEYVEATSHLADKSPQTIDMFDHYAQLARTSGSPLAHDAALFASALHADLGTADETFTAALAPSGIRMPFLRGRLMLALGTRLRHDQRTIEARVQLRSARDLFDSLGCPAWAYRAIDELAAAGERDPSRSPQLGELLTPQEIRIALLAADGLSNKEIAEKLYVSHRTVGSHLYSIFPKVGVTARAQLANALQAMSIR